MIDAMISDTKVVMDISRASENQCNSIAPQFQMISMKLINEPS